MVPIRRVYRSGSRRVSGTPSLLKNHLNMNQPSMNPEMKRSEYHLMETGPMLKISGFMLQCTASVSNINSLLNHANIIISLTTAQFFPVQMTQRSAKSPELLDFTCLCYEFDLQLVTEVPFMRHLHSTRQRRICASPICLLRYSSIAICCFSFSES